MQNKIKKINGVKNFTPPVIIIIYLKPKPKCINQETIDFSKENCVLLSQRTIEKVDVIICWVVFELYIVNNGGDGVEVQNKSL